MSSNSVSTIKLTDDEVMRRKLILEGNWDDRRLNMILKLFINWCKTDHKDSGDSVVHFERILQALCECELSMSKSAQTLRMAAKEMANYERLYEQTGESIVDCRQRLAKARDELRTAKRVREYRHEYESMATLINRHCDRSETTKKLRELRKEIQRIHSIRDDLNKRLDSRRQQFQVMLGASRQLNLFLSEDNDHSMDEQEVDVESDLIDDISDVDMDV